MLIARKFPPLDSLSRELSYRSLFRALKLVDSDAPRASEMVSNRAENTGGMECALTAPSSKGVSFGQKVP